MALWPACDQAFIIRIFLLNPYVISNLADLVTLGRSEAKKTG